jgi:zinc transport system substrate-binding protein
MNVNKKKFFYLISTLLMIFALSRLFLKESVKESPNAEKKLRVLATIFPLYDLLKNVSGDKVDLKVIVAPGASPHFFEIKAKEMQALQNADAIFAIGQGLDDWVLAIARAKPQVEIYNVDENVSLKSFPDGSKDPHYWLSFKNAEIMVESIEKALSKKDPKNRDFYASNAHAYKELLRKSYAELKLKLMTDAGASIMTFHDAWYYFADDFSLRIAGSFEPAAGEEPSARYVAKLIENIKKDKVSAIFIEPQISRSSIESFARDNSLNIGELDPIGGTKGRESFIELMTFNVNAVKESLEKAK